MTRPDPSEVKVLVVCLGELQCLLPRIGWYVNGLAAGNICRSPMGEAVLRHTAKERGLDIKVDSAGTAGYHIGEDPDERYIARHLP
jgi:hypothetical protein